MTDKQIDILKELVDNSIKNLQDVYERTNKREHWKEKIKELEDIERELENLKLKNVLKRGLEDNLGKSFLDNKFNEREFNYYFDEGTEVMLDEETGLPDGTDFYPINLQQHAGKKGVVKKVTKGLHAYGRGTSYDMDIEFDGELVERVSAYHVIEYKDGKS